MYDAIMEDACHNVSVKTHGIYLTKIEPEYKLWTFVASDVSV